MSLAQGHLSALHEAWIVLCVKCPWWALGRLKQKSTMNRYVATVKGCSSSLGPRGPGPSLSDHGRLCFWAPLCFRGARGLFCLLCRNPHPCLLCLPCSFPWALHGWCSAELTSWHLVCEDHVYRPECSASMESKASWRAACWPPAPELPGPRPGLTGSTFGVEPTLEWASTPISLWHVAFSSGDPSVHHVWELPMCSYSGLRPSCGLGSPLVVFSSGYMGDDCSQIPAFRWGCGKHGQSDGVSFRLRQHQAPGWPVIVLLCWRQAWSSVLRWQSCQMPATIGGGLMEQKEALFH